MDCLLLTPFLHSVWYLYVRHFSLRKGFVGCCADSLNVSILLSPSLLEGRPEPDLTMERHASSG
jgi:hypothetical protein